MKTANSIGLSSNSVFLFVNQGENIGPQFHGLRPWTDFWACSEEAKAWQWRRITTVQEAKETTAIINYSSGCGPQSMIATDNLKPGAHTISSTTGAPKGVELSHYNVIANSVQLIHKRSLVANNPNGQGRKARLDSSGERWVAPLPMFHAFVSFLPSSS